MSKTKYEEYRQQEQRCQFDRFTREDALQLGLLLHQNAQRFADPVSIEITVNGFSIFHYFPEGTNPDNAFWMGIKRNSVETMQMSSIRFMAWLEERGDTLEDRKLDPRRYATCGGGFPLLLRGTGMIGCICVSGLPHEQDHQLIVDTILEYTGRQ